jgi:hypothetical protein
MHEPPTQLCPCPQVFPQDPQFALSVCVSAQYALPPAPPSEVQSVSFDPQVLPQTPAEQTCQEAQAFPQPPQFAGSRLVSTQLCPHCVVPPPQESAQVPCEQTVPAPQAMPHTPQLAGSFAVFVHVDPHMLCPLGHEAWESTATSTLASVVLAGEPLLLPPQPWEAAVTPRRAPAQDHTAPIHLDRFRPSLFDIKMLLSRIRHLKRPHTQLQGHSQQGGALRAMGSYLPRPATPLRRRHLPNRGAAPVIVV